MAGEARRGRRQEDVAGEEVGDQVGERFCALAPPGALTSAAIARPATQRAEAAIPSRHHGAPPSIRRRPPATRRWLSRCTASGIAESSRSRPHLWRVPAQLYGQLRALRQRGWRPRRPSGMLAPWARTWYRSDARDPRLLAPSMAAVGGSRGPNGCASSWRRRSSTTPCASSSRGCISTPFARRRAARTSTSAGARTARRRS